MRLDEKVYSLDAVRLAKMLLGKLICRNIDGEIIRKRITQTEAYFGENDTACHAHKGKTKRTEVMYGECGRAYIYLCYGMHYMLNVVSGEKDFPQAVLIRGVEGFEGPGRTTKVLKIDKMLNAENLIISQRLWIEDDGFKCDFQEDKRIGIDYATEEYRNKLWNFRIK